MRLESEASQHYKSREISVYFGLRHLGDPKPQFLSSTSFTTVTTIYCSALHPNHTMAFAWKASGLTYVFLFYATNCLRKVLLRTWLTSFTIATTNTSRSPHESSDEVWKMTRDWQLSEEERWNLDSPNGTWVRPLGLTLLGELLEECDWRNSVQNGKQGEMKSVADANAAAAVESASST
jgi:hypothetical protein